MYEFKAALTFRKVSVSTVAAATEENLEERMLVAFLIMLGASGVLRKGLARWTQNN